MAGQVVDDPLEAVISQIVYSGGAAGVTRLMKLVYIAELEHRRRFGRPLTGASFVNYDYGPFSTDVYEAVERLQAKGAVVEEARQTAQGQMCRLQTPAMSSITVEPPTPFAADVIEHTVGRWGRRPLDELVSYAKSTAPYRGTRHGQELDIGVGAGTPFSAPCDVDLEATLPDFL